MTRARKAPTPAPPAPRAHMTRPCENCPYRVDAPRFLWDRAEFEGVLAAEAEVIGRVYSCHKQAPLPEPARGYCAGWLLDQKARDLPSIALRLDLSVHPDGVAALEAVSGEGLALFPSVAAMCRANGVRAPRGWVCPHCGQQNPTAEPYCGQCRLHRPAKER